MYKSLSLALKYCIYIIMKMLKKIFVFIIFIIFACINISNAQENKEVQKIREGTFAKVMVLEEFSSLNADIGDKLKFINTEDMYIYETNAIPKNTIFYGEVEDVREPVEDKDGAVKVLIYKMETPDKKIYDINAHIYSENENYLGGKTTESIYYRKVPHYNQNLRPFLQAAPLHILEMGKHILIKSGEEMFIIFDKDVYLK